MQIKLQCLPVAGLNLAAVTFSARYGQRINPVTGKAQVHHGVDLNRLITGQPINNQPVNAVESGTALVSKMQGNGKGYGNYIVINHGGWYTLYAHLSSRQVTAGQKVSQGQAIGTVGSTGNSTGPHLHFGICTSYSTGSPDSGSTWVDPLDYLKEVLKKEGGGGAEVKRYNKVSELPKTLQGEIQALVDCGALKGDEKGQLNITEDMARCLAVAKRYADSKTEKAKAKAKAKG